MRRAIVLVLALGMLVGALVGVGAAEEHGPPEHGHMLLQRWQVEIIDGQPHLTYRKCVDLAGGRSVPNHAHHDRVHMPTSNEEHGLHTAGHAVVPTAPLTPWANCEEFPQALPLGAGG